MMDKDQITGTDQINGKETRNPQTGIPRWLIYGFLAKMVLVIAVVAAVMWWAVR